MRRGIAGNLQTDDGRATVTWQPGAVPVGKTVSLDHFAGTLAVPGQRGLAHGAGAVVEGIPLAARPDVRAAAAEPDGARLLDRRQGLPLGAAAPAGRSFRRGRRSAGTSTSNNLTHVLTRTPFQVSLFKQGAWGDPTYTSPTGPALETQTQFQVLPHPADETPPPAHAARRALAGPDVGLGDRAARPDDPDSRQGQPLRLAASGRRSSSRRRRTAGSRARCRCACASTRARSLPGAYTLRVVAVDPWGRHGRLSAALPLSR